MTQNLTRKVPFQRFDEQFARYREDIMASLERVCRSGQFILGEGVVN